MSSGLKKILPARFSEGIPQKCRIPTLDQTASFPYYGFMDSPNSFTDEADMADDAFTDFEDDESVESFSDIDLRIDAEE